jgi:Protein of unknown function (DUF2752)
LNLVPEKRPWPRLLVFPLLSLAVVALGLARLFPDLIYRLAHCPLRDTTGIPCLTCGGTHSLVALTNGRWAEALAANPLVALGTVCFLLWSGYALVSTVVPGLRRSLEFPAHEKRAVRIVAALFLLGTWAWEFWQFR